MGEDLNVPESVEVKVAELKSLLDAMAVCKDSIELKRRYMQFCAYASKIDNVNYQVVAALNNQQHQELLEFTVRKTMLATFSDAQGAIRPIWPVNYTIVAIDDRMEIAGYKSVLIGRLQKDNKDLTRVALIKAVTSKVLDKLGKGGSLSDLETHDFARKMGYPYHAGASSLPAIVNLGGYDKTYMNKLQKGEIDTKIEKLWLGTSGCESCPEYRMMITGGAVDPGLYVFAGDIDNYFADCVATYMEDFRLQEGNVPLPEFARRQINTGN